jgi:hypothetical protein
MPWRRLLAPEKVQRPNGRGPAYRACAPSSSSMRRSWLYFATALAAARGTRLGKPGLGCDGEVGDEVVRGLARAVGNDRARREHGRRLVEPDRSGVEGEHDVFACCAPAVPTRMTRLWPWTTEDHPASPAPSWRHFVAGSGRTEAEWDGRRRKPEVGEPAVDVWKTACRRAVSVHRSQCSNPFSRSNSSDNPRLPRGFSFSAHWRLEPFSTPA